MKRLASPAHVPFTRIAARVLVMALPLALGGCERGCLARKLGELGVGAPPPGTPPSFASALSTQDCPEVRRCSGGAVERRGTNGGRCGFSGLGTCREGCVAEDVEVATDQSASLCRERPVVPGAVPDADRITLRPCDDEGLASCEAGLVTICHERREEPHARCPGGCAAATVGLDEAGDPASAVQLLCARP